MRNRLPIVLFACAALLIASLSRTNAAGDQSHAEERVIHHPKAEVEKAVQELRATLNGRLPILDGFATETDQPWDRFTRGYYECAVQVTANGQDEARVRVTAKVTAWYTDSNPAQSGYRVLLSNGRVETDLLDRIEEALATKGSVSASPESSQTTTSRPETSTHSTVTLPPARLRREATNLPVADTSGVVRGERSAVSRNLTGSSAAAITASPSSSEDVDSLRRRREEAEKKLTELNSVVQSLSEILHNQTHPTDIAVVRKSGAHVMSKPSANSPVLFSAASEDEFQVLDSGPDWVHVQISGVSRGWIRRSDLNLPEGPNANTNKADAAAPVAEPPFRVVREETNTFKGNWEQLNGKTVKIIWTGPASAQVKPASALAKRNFAKSLLISAYQEISSHDQAVAGVVIVFDSADGGQIASTFENLKQWRAGSLSEASFWRTCSVDPPELFSP
jgi:Bacterial SH3 domain